MELKKTDRLSKKLNKEKKDQTKTLIIFVIVLSILVILFAGIDIYQMIKVNELEAIIVKKDQVIAADLEVITGLEADIVKLENDIVAMANQSQQVREELKVFQHKYDELATVDTRLINRVKKVINFCNDETFIPDLLKIVAVLEEIIRRI